MSLVSGRGGSAERSSRDAPGPIKGDRPVLGCTLAPDHRAVARRRPTALAQGDINVVCSAPIPWCEATGGRVPEGNRHHRQHHAEGRRSDALAPARRGKNESRSTTSGMPATAIAHLQAADAGLTDEYRSRAAAATARLGGAPGGAVEVACGRLYAGALGIGYNASRSRRSNCRSRGAGPILRSPSIAMKFRCANPISSRTGICDDRDVRAGLRRRQGVRIAERHASERQELSAHRHGRNSRGGAGRNDHRRYVAARWRDGNRQRISDQAGRALRRARATRSAR